MVEVIFSISTRYGFDNFKRSLINISAECLDKRICVLVGGEDENLYLEIRDYLLDADDSNSITVWLNGRSISEVSKEITFGMDYVVFINENIVVPHNAINVLSGDMLVNHAGLISGSFEEFPTTCWVEDIYDPESIREKWGEVPLVTRENLVQVDTVFPYCFITKSSNFMELFGKNVDGFEGISYGILLRRLGYNNFIDTRVGLRYGGLK